jgi:hypothetical protein
VASSSSWGRRCGALDPFGPAVLASTDVLGSYHGALWPPAMGVLDDLLSFTRDFVVFGPGTWCLLAGSALHGPEREGRRPFPAIAWWVWCNEVRRFH